MDKKGTRVVKNVSWIIICRIIQAILSFIISIMTARYLGASNYGLINYAASIVAFATPIMKLGLDSVLVLEFVNNPDKDGEIVGTALGMNLFSAVLCVIGTTCFCLVANTGEIETFIVCVLYSFVLIAQSIEMIIYWFQAKLLSKYSALVSLFAYVIVSVYKTILLVTGKSVYWFAVSNAFDVLIIGIVLHAVFWHITKQKLRFSINRAKKMLSKGKYYIISGLMVTIFSQTDRIMLMLMVDGASVGYYSAAVSCAGITSFVFSALIESMKPVILEAKNKAKAIYELHIKQLYSVIIYAALFQSLIITIFAEVIVGIIYGGDFIPAVSGLKIIVWYTTFSYYGGAKDIWILAEGKQKYLITINFAGAIMNVALNFLLIPAFEILGAAFASLISQIFTNIIMGFVIRELRSNNILMLQSLNPKYFIGLIKMLAVIIRSRNNEVTLNS